MGIPLTKISEISTGWYHSLFLKSNGTVSAVQEKILNSQLGDGTAVNRLFPVQVLDNVQTLLSGIKAVSGGGNFSYFLKSDGNSLV